ncbi:molybdopterin-binding protein [Miniphocaeibacter massiliensis]|uniref:molybdopterin-binding protein n=1 Tax=Miniphocaeibacter massiliensis TaxID=2041841 RepID=UPI000C06DC00|nr:molybdopterin-binding protein [Miniphocaeibacter massiliensis]
MKKIRVEDAIGHILPHDMTKIVKDEYKGVAFKKGHIITEEDIPKLLDMGKEHIYILEKNENMVHENEAALILANICKNDYMDITDVVEGKIEIVATEDGFFEIDTERLFELNFLGDIAIATRTGNLPVKKGDVLAGTRIIPLLIDKKQLDRAEKIGGNTPLFKITPFKKLKVGIVTTGSEVYNGRITDKFTPVVKEKLKEYNLELLHHEVCDDNTDMIKSAITKIKDMGANLILCTGGMSVDPDDLTPAAISRSGAQIITHGTPTLPGSMFLVGYFKDETAIMGLPGCVMYTKTTVFDILFPYVVAGKKITREQIARLGYGGYCLKCDVCHYPNCEFGKGV